MKLKLLAAVAAGALGMAASSASAATYVTYFDWSNTGAGGSVVKRAGVIDENNAWGKATIVESPNLLTFTVELYGLAGLLNTGSGAGNDTPGNKQPFSYSSDGLYTVTPDNTHDPNPNDGPGHDQDFYYGGHGAWENTPFGTFSDFIGCCNASNDIRNGSAEAAPAPLVFTIAGNGISIANLYSNSDGATATGASEDGGWWFAADVTTSFDGGRTFTIAARDIRCINCGPGGVPEPATWGMMILGFFGAGAMIRRRYAFA